MEIVRAGGSILTVTENGYGKRTDIAEYRVQSRGGVGIINIATTDRNGDEDAHTPSAEKAHTCLP